MVDKKIIKIVISKLLKQSEIRKAVEQQSEPEYAGFLSKNVEKILIEEPNPIIEFLKKNSPLVYAELSNEIEEDETSNTINNLGADFLFNVMYACVRESLSNTGNNKAAISIANWKIYANNVLARNRVLSDIYGGESKWIGDNNTLFEELYDCGVGIVIRRETNSKLRHFRGDYAVSCAYSSYKITDSVVNAYLQANSTWINSDCQTDKRALDLDSTVWGLMQLTQMGLSYFFQLCRANYAGPLEYKFKREPNGRIALLNGFFDLQGSRYEKATFAACLFEQLNAFYEQEKSPLFKSLQLILPEDDARLNIETMAELLALIDKHNYPALKAIQLHRFNPSNKQHHVLLERLSARIQQLDIRTQIIIPTLDSADFSDRNQVEIRVKEDYKELQNHVLQNRRVAVQEKLLRQITQLETSSLDSGVSDSDETWTLGTTTELSVSVQQQQQQEQARIREYRQDAYHHEADLITRDNITDRCRHTWNRLDPETKKFSGYDNSVNDLGPLFDRWVVNSDIRWMEQSAVSELMKCAPQFRFGLPSQNSLPAGFFLEGHREGGLILRHNDFKQVALDIQKRKESDKEKRSPYILKLRKKTALVTAWEGDARQLAEFTRYCGDPAHASSVLWRVFTHSAEDSVGTSHDVNGAHGILKKWAEHCSDPISGEKAFDPAFLAHLFNEETGVNLKALGQLFYQEGCGQLSRSLPLSFGVLALLDSSQAVFNQFGEDYFKVWKTAFVDPHVNLSELVAKSQLRALEDCLTTLSQTNYSTLAPIFWALVAKQAQTSPDNNRFSRLWKAFKPLANYLVDHRLVLNPEILDQFLKNSADFQLPVFIERLIVTLEKFAEDPAQQQQILNNLACSGDWHYTVPYNHYHPDNVKSHPIEAALFSSENYKSLGDTEITSFIEGLRAKLSEDNRDYKVELLTQFLHQRLVVPQQATTEQIQWLLLGFERLFLCLDETRYSNDLVQLLLKLNDSSQEYAAPWLLYVLQTYLPDKMHRDDQVSFYPLFDFDDLLRHTWKNGETSILLSNKHRCSKETMEGYLARINQLDLTEHQKIQLFTRALLSHGEQADFICNAFENIKPDLLGYRFYFNLVLLACKGSVDQDHHAEQILSLLEKISGFSHVVRGDRSNGGRLVRGSSAWAWYEKMTASYQDSLDYLYQQSVLLGSPLKFWENFNTRIKVMEVGGERPEETVEVNLAKRVILFKLLEEIHFSQSINNEIEEKFRQCEQLTALLDKTDGTTVQALAEYIVDNPSRRNQLFKFLLMRVENEFPISKDIINEFEHNCVMRGRDYADDKESIEHVKRAIIGFKQKGGDSLDEREQGALYALFVKANHYSKEKRLDNLSLEDLTGIIYGDLARTLQEDPQNEANKAFLLAVMREIVFRKTGKWLNHTQFLTCLYSAMQNGENNQLYQVRTGEGKSLLILMRAAFLAFSGKTVDVLSAKESLAQRDQLEFSAVFKAMGLCSAYINQNSSPRDYVARNLRGGPRYGAINYATVSGLTLFRARCEWEKSKPIYGSVYSKANERIALLDEADHILLDERTQFNYSVGDGNRDEMWVYQIIYRFYNEKKEAFTQARVSRDQHLKLLIQRIMEAYPDSPKESNFVTQYQLKQPTQETYLKLKDLLIAAHRAANLQKDIDFCVTTEKARSGQAMTVRVAKVLINNQIQEGAIYSNGVQQFLHLRLNEEALAERDIPNFPIASETEVAVSQNVRQVLAQHYAGFEGFTGTTGDRQERDYLKRVYQVESVTKVPTYQRSQSKLLPAVFADDEEQQVDKICEAIVASRDKQPILILCRDDKEVTRIYRAVVERLSQRGHADMADRVILDLNAKAKDESELVDIAAKTGFVTLSSRMGRGTDIKPDSEYGLMVIRTYLAAKRITKQESGRQGRNGQQGVYQAILNDSQIKRDYENFKQQYPHLVEKYEKALQKKIEARRAKGLMIPENNAKLMQADIVAACQHYLKDQIGRTQAAKNNLVSILSTRCHQHLVDIDERDVEGKASELYTKYGPAYRQQVVRFLREVEIIGGETATYNGFVKQVRDLWENTFLDQPFPSDMIENFEEDEVSLSGDSRMLNSSSEEQTNLSLSSLVSCAHDYEKSRHVGEEKRMITAIENYSQILKKAWIKKQSIAKKKAELLDDIVELYRQSIEGKTLSKEQITQLRNMINNEQNSAILSQHRHWGNTFFKLFSESTLRDRVTSYRLVKDLNNYLDFLEEKGRENMFTRTRR